MQLIQDLNDHTERYGMLGGYTFRAEIEKILKGLGFKAADFEAPTATFSGGWRTILSSMASGCDHIDHVRTQLPYAMFVGIVAIIVGLIPSGFGFPWWISLPVGLGILFAGLRFFGRVAEEELKAMEVA